MTCFKGGFFFSFIIVLLDVLIVINIDLSPIPLLGAAFLLHLFTILHTLYSIF